MKKIKNNYNNEERLAFAKDSVLLIQKYNQYKTNNDSLQLFNTKNELSNILLYFVASILPISKVSHCNGKKFSIDEPESIDCIEDTIIIFLNKLENDDIDTSDYDKHPEKLIAFMKTLLDGYLLNARKKEVEIYQRHTDTFDENGEKIDNNEYVTLETLGDEENLTKEDKQYYAALSTKEESNDFDDKIDYLMSILSKLKEQDKYANYIDLLYIDRINNNPHTKKEIGKILGVSDSFVSRKEKEINSILKQEMKNYFNQ